MTWCWLMGHRLTGFREDEPVPIREGSSLVIVQRWWVCERCGAEQDAGTRKEFIPL